MFQQDDDGFSLVEVLIAMFLLAVLSLALLPLLIGATQLSVTNRDLATATAFANAQLAPVKAAFPAEPSSPKTCTSLRELADPDVDGPDGLTATIGVNDCPPAAADYPASVPVSVVVFDAEGGQLVTLTTRVPVGAP